MDGKSIDIKQDRLQKLMELCPELFAEKQLDWEKLKAAFGDGINFANERYVLNWAGKSDAFRVLQQPTTATLKPLPEESVNFDTTENLFIEGENLEVLKVLQKAYYGKVKCIIIDPPYNTGSDSFIYPDKFSEKKEDYLKRIGEKDEEGFLMKEGFFRKNSKDSGHFHSNWLSMIYPRLFLAKNLLRDDGVIFVHIDDNEVHNLRMVMNEIFGEENFVEQIIWKKRYGGGAKEKYLVNLHEYAVMYSKKKDALDPIFVSNNKEFIDKYYTRKDEHFEIKGPYRTQPLEAAKSMGERKNLVYDIPGPKGEAISPKRQWLWSKERVLKALQNDEIEFNKDKDGIWTVNIKQYLRDKDGNEKSLKVTSIIENIYTQHGSKEIEELFGNVNYFQYPKPTGLIKHLLRFASEQENAIVLDFFAGSGTAAQAVIELNKDDDGNRKFILVQLPEPCDENSEAFKAGYKTIADIAKERIRRVIRNLTPAPSPEGEGSKGRGESYAENLFKGASPLIFKNANQLKKEKTDAEDALWQALRNKQINNCKFRRQHPIGNFIADFYCHEKKLAIEVDGGYHNDTEQKAYDESRTQLINRFGVRVTRFTNKEILTSLPRVLKQISETLNSPSPEGEGRGEVGFKVFKLSSSNFKIWRGSDIDSEDKLLEQLDAFTDPVRPGSEKENMLYELMLKAGYELTSKVECIISNTPNPNPNPQGEREPFPMTGDTPLIPPPLTGGGEGEGVGFYSINNDELIIALDMMSDKLVERIIASKPKKVITLDSLFTGNDQLKTNTVLQMRDAGIDFKTI